MKKLILISALAFNCVAEEENLLGICDSYESIATSIMTARQDKMSMSEMVKLADNERLTLDIIEMAYDRPAFSAEKNKQSSIKQFANEIYLVCYKELSAK